MPEIGDDRAAFIPPWTTLAELGSKVPRARSLFLVVDNWELRVSDGVTPGGLTVGSTGGDGGSGGGPAFGTISVTGTDASQNLQADAAQDILTLTGQRGLQITPVPATDTVLIGFPDGGAYGNLWTFLGSAWGSAPPPAPTYTPQEGDISTDILIEGARKLWDGWAPVVVYLPAANPASTVLVNGRRLPRLDRSATGLLRFEHRVADVGYGQMSVAIKVASATATGVVSFVARIAAPADSLAPISFDTDNIFEHTATAGEFTVQIPLDNDDSAGPGDSVVVEVGRLGAASEDTFDDDLVVTGVWFCVS